MARRLEPSLGQQKFIRWRSEMGFSQPKAGEVLGLHPSQISRYERGERPSGATGASIEMITAGPWQVLATDWYRPPLADQETAVAANG